MRLIVQSGDEGLLALRLTSIC